MPRFAEEKTYLLEAALLGRTKKAATDHYMSHGTKALRYPGRGTLVAWLDELHPERKKRALGKTSGIRYAPELRHTAVIDLCTRRQSAEEVAKKIGVSRPTLYNRRNRLLVRRLFQ